jgi:hypothetical protein
MLDSFFFTVRVPVVARTCNENLEPCISQHLISIVVVELFFSHINRGLMDLL